MFNNLIESSSHREDFSRKGSIFLGTLVAYTLLLVLAGVGAVYAYDARLETQSTELALVTFVPIDSTTKPAATEPRNNRPRAATSTDTEVRPPVRPILIASTDNPLKVPDQAGTVGSSISPAPPGAVLGPIVSDRSGGPIGPPSQPGDGSGSPRGSSSAANPIKEDLPPPPVINKPKPSTIVSIGVVNSKAIDLPKPPYPPFAKPVRATGIVTVEILIDESGKVISAHAVSGHVLLRPAAVKAAYQARFSPTLLSKQPVKASGIITYNFTLQ